jgi:hypothetical protein
MRLERRGSGAGVGSGAEAENTGSEAGGGGFGAGDEGLRPRGGLSTSKGSKTNAQGCCRRRPPPQGLDSRSGNPNISRRVGRSSRLSSKGTATLRATLRGL